MRRGRDPLLGAPRPPSLDTPPDGADTVRRPWRERFGWIASGHFLFAVATLIGWEHLDVLWPTTLLPDGIPIGDGREVEGLLTLGDPGRPPRLASAESLREDWRHWIRLNQRQDSSECLPVPPQIRDQLIERGTARRDAGGAVQYWVKLRLDRRLGPAQCSTDGGLKVDQVLADVISIKRVPCSRDAFVAHGFLCPGERRSPMRQSETVVDVADYYPPAAATAGKVGRVQVRVERDASGSPVACTVLVSSGSDDLDRQTCKLIGTDPYFTYPSAQAGPGDLNSPITQSIDWRLAD